MIVSLDSKSNVLNVPLGAVLLVPEDTLKSRSLSYISVSSRENIIKPIYVGEMSAKFLHDDDRFKKNNYSVFQAIAPGKARVRYEISDELGKVVKTPIDVQVTVDPQLPKSIPSLESVKLMINTWRLRPKESLHFEVPLPYKVIIGADCKSVVRHRKNKSKLTLLAKQAGTCVIQVVGNANELLLEIPVIVEK